MADGRHPLLFKSPNYAAFFGLFRSIALFDLMLSRVFGDANGFLRFRR